MIIPMVCFSCGKPIAHLWFPYLELVKKFELEQKTNPSESSRTPEFLALADPSVGLVRQCCRRMFLCQHDMYTKIK